MITMSKTYREIKQYVCPTCGYDNRCERPLEHETHTVIRKVWKDEKPWYKPPGDFNRTRRRLRRAKVKQHLREAWYDPRKYETIPEFRKCDTWDFN